MVARRGVGDGGWGSRGKIMGREWLVLGLYIFFCD